MRYNKLVTVHCIMALLVTVHLQCSYRVRLRNFSPFIQSYTNDSSGITYFPLIVIIE